MNAQSVGKRVQSLREQHGMLQEHLGLKMMAAGFRWGQQAVSRTESGLRPVRLEEAVALAAILHCSMEQLAGVQPIAYDDIQTRSDLTKMKMLATQALQTIAAIGDERND